MQLHIRHETLYRYGEPVKHSIQNLRLTPRREPRQRALSWRINAPGRQAAQIDAHGNVVHLLTLDEPHHEVRIVASGVVETDDAQGIGLPDEGRLSPLAYLAATPLTLPDEMIRALAERHLARRRPDLQALLDFSHVVNAAVAYEPGKSEVHDSAATVLARGKGVCQDHAHVFIACCRAAGIPARYVSGYFYADTAFDVASHAWVDVWLDDERGWLGLDVSHRELPGGRHCRLAIGRDYLDACPVRGVRHGGGAETMDVNVLVATSAQQQ